MPRQLRIFSMHAMYEEPGICTPQADGSPRSVIVESKIEILVDRIR
jgi:hypothetical protein